MLYLMPKSSSRPPGLWLAERTRPPSAPRRRMTAETAGVERMPPRPTSTRAEAVGRGHADDGLDGLAVVVATVAADDQRLARRSPRPRPRARRRRPTGRSSQGSPGCMKTRVFFRRPEVPGRCPSNGLVGTVCAFSPRNGVKASPPLFVFGIRVNRQFMPESLGRQNVARRKNVSGGFRVVLILFGGAVKRRACRALTASKIFLEKCAIVGHFFETRGRSCDICPDASFSISSRICRR